jgi:hypothetical protein
MAHAATMDDMTMLERDARVQTERTLADRLLAYHRGLRSARLDDRLAFRDAIVGAINLLGYTGRDISREFNCTPMTVNRWTRGEAAPFAGMRRVIYEKLQSETERRLRAFKLAA